MMLTLTQQAVLLILASSSIAAPSRTLSKRVMTLGSYASDMISLIPPSGCSTVCAPWQSDLQSCAALADPASQVTCACSQAIIMEMQDCEACLQGSGSIPGDQHNQANTDFHVFIGQCQSAGAASAGLILSSVAGTLTTTTNTPASTPTTTTSPANNPSTTTQAIGGTTTSSSSTFTSPTTTSTTLSGTGTSLNLQSTTTQTPLTRSTTGTTSAKVVTSTPVTSTSPSAASATTGSHTILSNVKQHAGMYAGIAVGLVALIAAAIGVFCCCRNFKRREKRLSLGRYQGLEEAKPIVASNH